MLTRCVSSRDLHSRGVATRAQVHFRVYRSTLYMKVIGSGLRSQEQKSVKCDPATPRLVWEHVQRQQVHLSHSGYDATRQYGQASLHIACGTWTLNVDLPQLAGWVCGLRILQSADRPWNDGACLCVLFLDGMPLIESESCYICFWCHVSDAYENARFLCEQYYMTAPGCDIECHNRKFVLSRCQFILFLYHSSAIVTPARLCCCNVSQSTCHSSIVAANDKTSIKFYVSMSAAVWMVYEW